VFIVSIIEGVTPPLPLPNNTRDIAETISAPIRVGRFHLPESRESQIWFLNRRTTNMTKTPHKAIGTLAYFVLRELPNEVMQDEYTQSHVYPTALDVRSWLQEIGEWDDYQGGLDDHVRGRPSHGVGIDNRYFPVGISVTPLAAAFSATRARRALVAALPVRGPSGPFFGPSGPPT
jgi:hypothetical protein